MTEPAEVDYEKEKLYQVEIDKLERDTFSSTILEEQKTHPLMYVTGKTAGLDFPLILVIGREPNDEGMLSKSIGVIDNAKFKSLRSGVWVAAYSQFDEMLPNFKSICLERNCSPVVFANAFPKAILNSVNNKEEIRIKLLNLIPANIDSIFKSLIIRRVSLVIHHGIMDTQSSKLATSSIKDKCTKLGILYCATPFLDNRKFSEIKDSLKYRKTEIKNILEQFLLKTA